MKKILLILGLVLGLFAQENFYCMAVKEVRGDVVYKYSTKEMDENTVVISKDDHVISDGKYNYNYIGTIKGVDYYKNKKLHIVFGMLSEPTDAKNQIYSAIITNLDDNSNTSTVLLCKPVK